MELSHISHAHNGHLYSAGPVINCFTAANIIYVVSCSAHMISEKKARPIKTAHLKSCLSSLKVINLSE